MGNFAGYFAKFKQGGSSADFPTGYIMTAEFNPDIRTDLKAYRDANGDLQRATLTNFKSKFVITTLPGLHLSQKIEIETAMAAGCLNTVQHKYHIKYWNDAVGVNNYDEGDFYLVDQTIKPLEITNDDIIYDSLVYTFVEY